MDFGASFVQRFERSPKRGDVLVRRRQAACELDELVGMWIYLGISEPRCELADTPLDPPALSFELQRVRVPGRQRGLEPLEVGIGLLGLRRGEKLLNLVDDHAKGSRLGLGPAERLSDERQGRGQGRAAYLRPRPDPSLTARSTATLLPMLRPLAAIVASICLAGTGSALAATRAESPLGARLAKALRVPHVSRSRSAALAVDLTTGQPLYAQNDALPLAPASNEKLAVTYATLTALGPSFRLETRVDEDGEREGTTLHGDLYLVGGGDPTLSSANLQVLAAAVRAAGIGRVDGRVLGDESLFDTRRTCAGWKASFYIEESAPLSALVVDGDHYLGHVSRDPALTAALLFRDALRKAGVRVLGQVGIGTSPTAALPVASVHSAPLARIVEDMDLQSDNFTAELLLKQLGLLQSAPATTSAGAQTVMRLLGADGIPLGGVRIVDGSGLSQLDRLTTDALVTIIRTMWNDPQLKPILLRALPVAGMTGTLHYRMRTPPLRGNVRAKTGTTDDASALTGFVRDRYAFSIVQNGHPLAYWWARVAQDRFAKILASQ